MSLKSYLSLNIYSILLVYIFFLIHISFAFPQLSSTNVTQLSEGDNFQAKVSLNLNENATFRLSFTKPVTNTTKFIAEWITSPIESIQAVKNGLPDAILWFDEKGSIPIRTSGQRSSEDRQSSVQKCSKYYPCFDKGNSDETENEKPSDSVGSDSFWTSYNRSYISVSLQDIQQQQTNRTWMISIKNYDRGRAWPSNAGLPKLQPKLNGILYVRVVSNDSLSCPGFVLDPKNENTTKLCGNHGTCEGGRCKCKPEYGGLDCMQSIEQISLNDKMKELKENKNVQIASITLQPYDQKIFHFKPLNHQQKVKLLLEINNGTFCEKGLPEKKLKDANETRLQYDIKQGNIEDKTDLSLSFSDSGPPPNQSTNSSSDKCTNMRVGQYPILGETMMLIYANATGSRTEKPSPLDIVISAKLCEPDGKDICPAGGTRVTLQLIIVFICLVTVAVTAIFMFAMFWLDRMHGFTRNIDRLTQAEVDRMYPSKSYPSQIADPDNGQRQTGHNRDVENVTSPPLQEVECSICLCEFEDTDMVRKLTCNHVFHSSCLDVSFLLFLLVLNHSNEIRLHNR